MERSTKIRRSLEVLLSPSTQLQKESQTSLLSFFKPSVGKLTGAYATYASAPPIPMLQLGRFNENVLFEFFVSLKLFVFILLKMFVSIFVLNILVIYISLSKPT